MKPARGAKASMGQKTHPKLFRLGVIETWDSEWFARHDYSETACMKIFALPSF